MNDEQCDTCRFWRYISAASHGDHDRGDCRRHAPKPADEEHGKNLVDYCGTWWPETDSDNWCGEYQRRPLPTV